MKLIKTFFLIILVFFLLYFLHLNDARVDVNLIYKVFEQIPVSIILLGSLGLGVIIGYLLSLIYIFKIKSDLRKIDNKNRTLNDELNSLRNIAVDEEIISEELD